jgi:hypothetical protein
MPFRPVSFVPMFTVIGLQFGSLVAFVASRAALAAEILLLRTNSPSYYD